MGVGANDLVERLESALAPWMAKKSEPLDLGEAFSPRDNSAPLQELERKRLYAYSLAKLRPRCTELAAMGENSGRNTAAYKLAAAIGRYVHHGIIARKEAADEILAACEQNGLIKEDGRASVVATIRSGLHSARNDPLPALPDRRSSKERTVKQTNVGDHVDGRPKRQGSPQLTGKREPRIYLVPFQEIRLGTRRRDLVARLIPRVGLIIVWGPPKCGKSFWAFDLAMHVALGWEYRGRRVHQGPVVYCAFEGQTGIEARIEAFRQRYLAEESAEPPPFYLEPGNPQSCGRAPGPHCCDPPPAFRD